MSATRTQIIPPLTTTGTQLVAECSGMVWLTLYLKGAGVITSGVIVLEEADYFGVIPPVGPTTWSPLLTINAADVTAADASSTAQIVYPLPVRAYGVIRARLTTDIGGGGTVSAELIAVGP